MFQSLSLVALGGAFGAAARYLVSLAALRLLGTGFPWATLCVNVVGSFAMGFLYAILSPRPGPLLPFLLTGILGGFTTFSAFSLDAVTLWQRGEPTLAALYVGGSILLSFMALITGAALARGVIA